VAVNIFPKLLVRAMLKLVPKKLDFLKKGLW